METFSLVMQIVESVLQMHVLAIPSIGRKTEADSSDNIVKNLFRIARILFKVRVLVQLGLWQRP